MRVVAKRPINQKAANAADDDFYKKHPEFVQNGQRIPIDFCDPKHDKFRDEWMRLYQKHGGDVEPDKSTRKPGNPVADCPLMRGDLWISVVDNANGSPLEDVTVIVSGPDRRTGVTNGSGDVIFSDLKPGSYSVEASKPRFSTEKSNTAVKPYQTNNDKLALEPQGLYGFVRNANTRSPISGAKVILTDRSREGQLSTTTDASGMYVFTELEPGDYELEASKLDFTFEEPTAVLGTVVAGQMTAVDVILHPIPKFSVGIDLDPDTQTLTPLNFPNGNFRDSKIRFKIHIKSDEPSFQADHTEISVLVKGRVIFKQTHRSDFVKAGKYVWQWDGFDSNGVLDTQQLKGSGRQVKVVVTKGNVSKSSTQSFDIRLNLSNIISNPGQIVPWIDVKVDVPSHKVDIRVFVDCQNEDDLPSATFNRLKTLVLDGIGHYWSRSITVGGQQFQVRTLAAQRDDDSVDLDLYLEDYTAYEEQLKRLGIDPSEYLRSHNTGLIDASIKYNQGYFKKRYPNNAAQAQAEADKDYKVTAAHEWGHSVLEAFGGRSLSWTHKGSSNYRQDTESSSPTYPATGEIDLMIYYNGFEPADYALRVIAAEEDVKRLLWLARMDFLE